ncbi:hypothetical protein LWI29_004689 [Acer saccharum]|uniref:Uncharacterized protein n=1 Tax=Acer saccharum TaxID=4024 RepID=A0AA39RQ09_ACESA|nr:hypothetical protein LWI29_004689 [Acer saccharum]
MEALNKVRSGLQDSPKSVTVEGVSLDKEVVSNMNLSAEHWPAINNENIQMERSTLILQITKSRPSMELEFSQANKHNKEIEKLVSELGSGSICHV